MALALLQSSLPSFPCPIAAAVADMSDTEGDERGAVFTRREVVDFILDLVGYTTDQPLHSFRLLEPSFGHGDFLLPAVERLLDSYRGVDVVGDLSRAIRAVEVHQRSVAATADKVRALICGRGYRPDEADKLVAAWIVHDDFLLCELPAGFTHVVGNPPYLRQEAIPAPLLAEYRRRYRTIYARADLYIPFFERGLTLLARDGALGFICSDRWMKNRYGGPLRAMVAKDFHVDIYVDMVDTPAFHSDVIAYPAITVITRIKSGVTRLAHRPVIDKQRLSALARVLRDGDVLPGDTVTEVSDIAMGAEPWMLNASRQLALVRRLESLFPTLEEAGCKVGIGVATGADSIFIGAMDALDVEPERKLPLVTTKDICSGTVVWQGLGVVNPFDDGGLVDLARFPRLALYMNRHGEAIRRRNVAQRNPATWYRTIDRITPALAARPKLLIPDIKGEAHVVYEEGRYYPHHNLYYIVSDGWDLRALQAILLSGIAKLFVAAYSVKMRGGHLRFQAQYLRRIRLPRWRDVGPEQRHALIAAAERGDKASCDRLAFDVYGLTQAEREVLGEK